jgi:hypothetical protein
MPAKEELGVTIIDILHDDKRPVRVDNHLVFHRVESDSALRFAIETEEML